MRAIRLTFAFWLLIGCCASHAAAPQSSCFLKGDDDAKVDRSASRTPLPRAGIVILTPCRGTVLDDRVWMWFATPDGQTRRKVVERPDTLQKAIGGIETVPLADTGSLWQRLISAISDERATKAGVSRFDIRYGIRIEGFIYPGAEVRLPLDAFRWDGNAAVTLTWPSGRSETLVPNKGRLRLPVARMTEGSYTLQQGTLRGSIVVPASDDLSELRGALAAIDQEESDPQVRLLRRSILFSGGFYVVNLVSENVGD